MIFVDPLQNYQYTCPFKLSYEHICHIFGLPGTLIFLKEKIDIPYHRGRSQLDVGFEMNILKSGLYLLGNEIHSVFHSFYIFPTS